MKRNSWWGNDLLERSGADAVWARGSDAFTHSTLRGRISEFAALFQRHGIGSGNTVAVQLPPSFTVAFALFALWSRGAQVLLLDARLTADEVNRLLSAHRTQFLVRDTSARNAVIAFRDECSVAVSSLSGGRPARTEHCLIQLSSGSTGQPKLIGRTANSLREEITRVGAVPGMPAMGERVLLLGSLVHSLGLFVGLLHSLDVGAELVLTPALTPREVLRTALDEEVHAIVGVPANFELLGSLSEVPRWSALRLLISGGDALRPAVRVRAEELFGVPMGQVYGMTETGLIATDLSGEFEPPAVGRPLPGLRYKIEEEELFVGMDSSPYLQDDGLGRFEGGWLRTYDRCAHDSRTDVLSVLGRADSQVVIGGLKVDLVEVERVLREHPAVAEVVVVHSDTIEAYVEAPPSLTTSELLAWCRPRLSAFKLPRRLHLTRALPRTANGKLLRRPLSVHVMSGKE